MKILHVIPSLSPALGGPTYVALQTVKAIRMLGIDAEIVTTNHNGTETLDVPLACLTEYEGVPVWFLPVTSTLKEYIFSASLTKWLWQNLARYDLLDNHYLFSYAPTCAAAIARYQQIPYTIRTQGQLTPWALRQSPIKKQLYTLAIERHNLNNAAAIHCTTPQEAKDLRNFGIHTPSITLPLGVEPVTQIANAPLELRKTYNLPGDRQIILFLSRLHPKKRPELLVHAFQQITARHHNCQLVLAGSGDPDYVKSLQQLVLEYNLSDRTTFTGFVTGYEKNLCLQGADLFVLPSHSENFGIAVAEAMTAGLPTIITPGVQISDDIAAAEAGIIINNLDELVDAIEKLLRSKAKRSHLGQNAVKLTKAKYSWEGIATQLVGHYQKAIASRI